MPRRPLFAALALLALLGFFFQFSDLDQQAAAFYWDQGHDPWQGRLWPWAAWLYRFGEAPANLVGLLGGLAFALSFTAPQRRAWRGPGLFLFLMLALGPGLLVNGLLKPLFGRPRPHETLGYGGLWEFHRVLHLGPAGRGNSFCSGHASSAWYFLALPFLLLGWRRWLAITAAVAFGLLMSWARVAQGDHYVSDTLFSGALMLLLASALAPLIRWQPSAAFFSRRQVRWALALGGLALLSLGKVAYEDRRFYAVWRTGPDSPAHVPPQMRVIPWQADQVPSDLALDLDLRDYDVTVAFDQGINGRVLPFKFEARFHGQGLPGAKESLFQEDFVPGGFNLSPGSLAVRLRQSHRGFWLSKAAEADLGLPHSLAVDARLHSDKGTITMGPLPAGRRVLISRLPEGSKPPAGFEPFGSHGWLRDGEPPFIALDLDAPLVRFSQN